MDEHGRQGAIVSDVIAELVNRKNVALAERDQLRALLQQVREACDEAHAHPRQHIVALIDKSGIDLSGGVHRGSHHDHELHAGWARWNV